MSEFFIKYLKGIYQVGWLLLDRQGLDAMLLETLIVLAFSRLFKGQIRENSGNSSFTFIQELSD